MEIWKDIKGYEGLYQVSSYGRVMSLGNGKSGKSIQRIMKPHKTNKGYLQVGLCKDGVRKLFKIHRLVAAAFIPNLLDYTQVNHRDENKENNHIDNLEYCDNTYNYHYGTRIERVSEINKNNSCSRPIIQYELDGTFVREWPSIRETKRECGYNNRGIIGCCNGEFKTAYGYIWRYKEKKEAS